MSEERGELSPAEALNKFVNDMECNVNPYHQFHRLKAYVEQVASTKQVIVARAANSTRMAEIIPIRRDLPEEGSAESIKEVKSVFKKLPPGRLAARRIVYELKMRDQCQEAQKHEAAVRAEKGLDHEWLDRVNALLKKDLSGGSPAQLKIQINLLARELLIAPSEEDWRWLSGYISSLKEQLLASGQPVQLVIGLMPPAS